MRIDLHTHTTASDGMLTPTALVAEAAAVGVDVLAVTDHDTVAAVREAEAAASSLGLALVPGIELGCTGEGEHGDGPVDILGYLVDVDDRDLGELCREIAASRVERARAMVAILQRLGADVTLERVLAMAAGGVVGRPHVARALVEAGFVPDTVTAFRQWIGRSCPAYVERYRLTPEAGCRAVRSAGGVPALAHPVPRHNPTSDPLRLRHYLPVLLDSGLGGLECYYPGYAGRTSRWLVALADHFGLVPTGGSDYHGPLRPGMALGSVVVPHYTVDRLVAAAKGERPM